MSSCDHGHDPSVNPDATITIHIIKRDDGGWCTDCHTVGDANKVTLANLATVLDEFAKQMMGQHVVVTREKAAREAYREMQAEVDAELARLANEKDD